MEESIFLFVPNIIGYARIVLALASFYLMLSNPWLAVSLYLTSVILDEFDGRAARKYNQCTNFGGLLDVITDILSSAGMLAVLGYFYPSYIFIFQLVMILDISSHWISTHSSALHRKSHKEIDSSAHPLLRFYYIPSILTLFCATTQLFLTALYILHFTPGILISVFGYEVGIWTIVAVITFPFQVLRQCVCVLQLVAACKDIAAFDIAQRAYNSTQLQNMGTKTT